MSRGTILLCCVIAAESVALWLLVKHLAAVL